jgi:hypothetical protein
VNDRGIRPGGCPGHSQKVADSEFDGIEGEFNSSTVEGARLSREARAVALPGRLWCAPTLQ